MFKSLFMIYDLELRSMTKRGKMAVVDSELYIVIDVRKVEFECFNEFIIEWPF